MMDYSIFYVICGEMEKTDKLRICEGFQGQRLTVISPQIKKRCRDLPMVSQLYITDIGNYPSAPNHYVQRKQGLNSVVLIYCTKGRGSLKIDNTTHKISRGQLVIIPKHTPHIYKAEPLEPWSIFWIHFTGEQTDALLGSMGVDAGNPSLYVPDTQVMQQAFEDVYACLNYHYSNAGLLAMTSELLRLFSLAKLHQCFPNSQRQSAENRIVASQKFMERHLDIAFTVEELAAHAGQSVPYYSRLFKDRTNQSPIAYFIQLKVRKACELLEQTDMSVREIAAEIGYEDPYYFSRIFKKVQGNSPTTYRASIQTVA